jgi:hypothetical protein
MMRIPSGCGERGRFALEVWIRGEARRGGRPVGWYIYSMGAKGVLRSNTKGPTWNWPGYVSGKTDSIMRRWVVKGPWP